MIASRLNRLGEQPYPLEMVKHTKQKRKGVRNMGERKSPLAQGAASRGRVFEVISAAGGPLAD